MAGNGYYAEGLYQPKSTQTWDNLTGNWDAYVGWSFTPDLPLTFTTNIIDVGQSQYVNYDCEVSATYPVNITVQYGDTIDSSGGSIDSPSTINVTPNQSLTGAKGRYWQFTISVDYADSAGTDIPTIGSITTNLKSGVETVNVSSINSSTLSGSVGERQLSAVSKIGAVTGAVVTPHTSSAAYVATGYVVSEDSAGESYVEIGDVVLPHIVIDKTTDPITLIIRDLNTYGKTKIDCTFDAVLTGLPTIQSDGNGNIVSG